MGSTDLSAAQSVGSLQGEVLGIAKTSDGRVFINGATKVILADVVANNGVVHVIDEVLLPPSVVDVGAVIDDAIDTGVPLFNDGDQEGCFAIYMSTAQSLSADFSERRISQA